MITRTLRKSTGLGAQDLVRARKDYDLREIVNLENIIYHYYYYYYCKRKIA